MLRATAPRARLQQQQQLSLRWVDVCVAPCGVPVDPAGIYRVGGGGYRGSEPFHLPRQTGQVFLEARVGSQGKHIAGMILMIVGIANVIGGVVVYSLASSLNTDTTSSGVDARSLYRFEGVAEGIVGVVLMAIGIPMMATSGTSVEMR
jgi:hypothetical protein